jgi:hypothetical protein
MSTATHPSDDRTRTDTETEWRVLRRLDERLTLLDEESA